MEFLQGTITAAAIRDDDVYPGVRASLEARLATARLKFSVDFNVGDPAIPAPIRTAVPLLLGNPIEVLAYPKVMVVAEKLVTALQRGRASTRWRDFADLFMLVPATWPSPKSSTRCVPSPSIEECRYDRSLKCWKGCPRRRRHAGQRGASDPSPELLSRSTPSSANPLTGVRRGRTRRLR